jgi:hypothetical protein
VLPATARLIAYVVAIALLGIYFVDQLMDAAEPVEPLGFPGAIYVQASGTRHSVAGAHLRVDGHTWTFSVYIRDAVPESRITVAASGASLSVVDCLLRADGELMATSTVDPPAIWDPSLGAWDVSLTRAAQLRPASASAGDLRQDCTGAAATFRRPLGGSQQLRLPGLRVDVVGGDTEGEFPTDSEGCASLAIGIAESETVRSLVPAPVVTDRSNQADSIAHRRDVLEGVDPTLSEEWLDCTTGSAVREDPGAERCLSRASGLCSTGPDDLELTVSTPWVSGYLGDVVAEEARDRSLFVSGAVLGLIGGLAVESFGLVLVVGGSLVNRVRRHAPTPAAQRLAPAATSANAGVGSATGSVVRRLRRTASRDRNAHQARWRRTRRHR